jgi:rhodanese-related sulfurtransferase
MNNLSIEEFQQWIQGNKPFLLVDVREEFEREAFNIGGIHIPLGEILERKEELVKDEPVVLYCEKGIRSGIIIQRLESYGFKNLYNLSGGISSLKNFQL